MRALALILAVAIVACSRAPRTFVGDRQYIRAAEIATTRSTSVNAYDLVAKLRPEFLHARGPISASRGRATELPASTVFVDGVESGPAPEALPRIPASEVVEIRLYRAADATTKYGTRHGGGVIEVTTVRSVRP